MLNLTKEKVAPKSLGFNLPKEKKAPNSLDFIQKTEALMSKFSLSILDL